MAGIVIADASPVIGLSIIDKLEWLPELFGAVWIPVAVRNEILPDRSAPGEAVIRQALEQGWIKVWDKPFELLPDLGLDEGESACISIAAGCTEPVLLLIDERAGRAVAGEYGLKITGLAALVGQAKKRGLIANAHEVFDQLHRAGFRMAPVVIRSVLERVGEL
jgi:predicted nucleic acid-binding protein